MDFAGKPASRHLSQVLLPGSSIHVCLPFDYIIRLKLQTSKENILEGIANRRMGVPGKLRHERIVSLIPLPKQFHEGVTTMAGDTGHTPLGQRRSSLNPFSAELHRAEIVQPKPLLPRRSSVATKNSNSITKMTN